MENRHKWSLSTRWFIVKPLRFINLFKLNLWLKLCSQMKINCLYLQTSFLCVCPTKSFGLLLAGHRPSALRFHTFPATRNFKNSSSFTVCSCVRCFNRENFQLFPSFLSFIIHWWKTIFSHFRDLHERGQIEAINCQETINFPRVLLCENCKLIRKQST